MEQRRVSGGPEYDSAHSVEGAAAETWRWKGHEQSSRQPAADERTPVSGFLGMGGRKAVL